MDSYNTVEMFGSTLSMLISLVLLPLGLLLYQVHLHISAAGPQQRKLLAQSSGYSCAGQFVAFIVSVIAIGENMHALNGTVYAVLCSLASYFILVAICKLSEPEARWAAIWIAIVSIPAQTYAFGWAFPG